MLVGFSPASFCQRRMIYNISPISAPRSQKGRKGRPTACAAAAAISALRHAYSAPRYSGARCRRGHAGSYSSVSTTALPDLRP